MTSPTLSVLMPNYNHAAYLAEAIAGIVGQSRPPDEFLILDDASRDNSLDVITPFLDQYPFIRLIRHERNQGVNAACQRLFAEARGDYVFSAAADDIRLPDFFQNAMSMAERFPQAGLVFGIVSTIDEQGRELFSSALSRWQEACYADPQRFLREYLAVERPSHSATSAAIYRRDAMQEVGGYRADLGPWADTFAFRAIGLKYGVCYLPVEGVQSRVIVGSYSHQTRVQPWKTLDLIARAVSTMQSPEFSDRFPVEHVRQWQRDYRWQVIRDYFLGPETMGRPRPSFVFRNLRRLPRLLSTLRMFLYQGDVSCNQQSR